MIFHENQIYLDCYREACWTDKELGGHRSGVNLFINSESRDNQQQDKFVGSGRSDSCATMVAQLVIQHFAIHCDEDNGYRKARQSHSLVLQRLMECWKSRKVMQWDSFLYNSGAMTVQDDVRQSSRKYSVFDTEYLIRYRIDTCRPDKIIRAKC